MKKFKLVDNARQRSIDYKDGEPQSIAYRFFLQEQYEAAKRYVTSCQKHMRVELEDLGFSTDDFNLILTCYNNRDSSFFFETMPNVDPIRLCVMESHWVDILE